jgi:hypothetical protein
METRDKILPQTKERTASDTLIRLAHLLARQAARQLMDKGASSLRYEMDDLTTYIDRNREGRNI